MGPAAILQVLVTADTRKAQAGLAGLNRQLAESDSATRRVGGQFAKLGKVAAIGVAGGLAYAVKKAADFEQQMDSLGAVANASGKQMERLRQQAMKAGADTKFSALEAAKAQTELAKGGLSVSKIMKGGLRSSLALAAAGELDLADAAETSANAIKLFGLRGRDSMKVADALATAANRTTADVRDFALALKMGGSVAKMAGLSFNETVVVLEALAEAGIKGSDAGTSMKAFFLNITRDVPKAREAMEQLGLEIFNQRGQIKGLAAISTELRDSFGSLTREQFLQKAGVIAGSDAVRTLWALYDAGPAKLRRLEEATGKSGTAAKVAAEKQDNFKGKLENLQGSIETIAISVGSKLLPSLTKAAEKITDLLNDKSLSNTEKLERFADMAGAAVAVGVEKAVEAAAAAGPKLAAGLARGFARFWQDANPIAKVFGTAAMIRLIGGRGSLLATGAAIGRVLGIGVGSGMAAGAAGGAGMGAGAAAGGGLFGGLISKLKTGAGRAGAIGLGVMFADQVITAFGNRTAQRSDDMWKALEATAKPEGFVPEEIMPIAKLEEFVRGGEEARKTADRLRGALSDIAERSRAISPAGAKRLRDMIGSLDDVSDDAKRSMNELVNFGVARFQKIGDLKLQFARLRSGAVDNLGEMRRVVGRNLRDIEDVIGLHTRRGSEHARDNFQAAAKWIKVHMSNSEGLTRRGTREMERLIKTHTRQGALGAKGNLGDFVKAIDGAMGRGYSKTKEGAKLIHGLFVESVKMYGLQPQKALLLAGKNIGQSIGDVGNVVGRQRGGPINVGAPSGDTVPAMLERGEYVLNREVVKKLGRRQLDAINFGMAPRFQGGGIVELLHPGNDPAHSDHLHIAASTPRRIIEIGRWLQSQGWLVSEHPAFGGVDPVHTSGSYHYSARAIDVNWPDASVEAAKIAAVLPMLGSAAGAAPAIEQIKRLMVDGPDSPLKAISQRVLDANVAAANQALSSLMPIEGAEAITGGKWQATLRSIAQQRGWSVGDWMELVMRESGGNPAAVNPSSGAYGLGQFLGSTKTAYAKFGATSRDGSAQINAMAHYIADRYGNPSSALAFHDAHNWYAAGGIVGDDRRGGQFGQPDRLRDVTPKGLAGWLTYALKAAGRAQRPKMRRAAVDTLLDRIRKLGVAPGVFNEVRELTGKATRAEEFAGMAASMTDESAIMDTLQQELERRSAAGQAFPEGDQWKMVQGMLGRVEGKTEPEWLKAQLDNLFKLRNRLLSADPLVLKKRDKVSKFIEEAQGRLRALVDEIRKRERRIEWLTREIGKMQKRLERELAKPPEERNTKLIGQLREGIKKHKEERQGHREWLPPARRRRETLRQQVIPEAIKQRQGLNTLRGNLISGSDDILGLHDVQGKFSTTEIFKELPGLGVLGGQIFEVQSALKRWLPPKVDTKGQVVDFAAGAFAGEEIDQSAIFEQERLRQLNELLRQQLQESQQRFAVSQKQYDVLRDFPFMGAFAKGGVAVVGERGPELAHMPSGTRVHSTADTQSLLTPDVRVVINGDIVNTPRGRDPVELVLNDRRFPVAVEKATRRASGRRPLPGRGGGVN